MKRALVVGAVAEERDGDRAVAAPLGAERGADGDRQAAADDAVGAEVAARGIGDVHRAAAPLAIAGFLAEEFGEHRLQVGALGDAMAMAAVGRGDSVGVGQRHADPDRRRLLPDREMHGAVGQPAHIRVFGRFLEAADAVHAPQGIERVGRREPEIDGRAMGDVRMRGAGAVRHEGVLLGGEVRRSGANSRRDALLYA